MNRALVALAAVAALCPVVALAVATPDPSTLKSALAEAPSGDYVEADAGTKGEGPFDAAGYADAFVEASQRPAAEKRLAADGFVTGYTRLWAKTGAGEALIEQILAFNDRSGAISFYGSSKVADLASTQFDGSVDTGGIPDSYGVKDKQTGAVAVAVAFNKGNDVFVVALASTSGYLIPDTVSQAQKVYSTAPDYTIQPPASAGTAPGAFNAGALVGGITIGIAVLLVIVAVVFFLLRRTQRPAMVVAGPAIQMSADRRFWWDGAAWNDANVVAPAHAQRSVDGAFWWDGAAWRPVPR